MASAENQSFIQSLDPATTALVVIDLQNGIIGLPLAPYSGPQIVEAAKQLADKCRAAAATIIWIRVGWSKDFGEALKQPVDQPSRHGAGGLPAGWSDLVDGLARPDELVILKRQWSAFHGTELDLQLRRRGIKTVILCGIATTIGVESTARQAWEHGYNLVIAEDVCTGFSAEAQSFAFTQIFPRIGIVAKSAEITFTKYTPRE